MPFQPSRRDSTIQVPESVRKKQSEDEKADKQKPDGNREEWDDLEMRTKGTSLSIPAADKDKCDLGEQVVHELKQKSHPFYTANRLLHCVPCKNASEEDTDADSGLRRVRSGGWWLGQLTSFMPILTWLPGLRKSGFMDVLTSDVIAGLTVGVVAIPQGMSYANIAGLQYHYGLYSALLGPVIYSLFGQSRQLAVGPVAIVSLLVEAGLNGLLTEEECPAYFNDNPDGLGQNELCPDQYARLVFLTSFWVGAIQLVGRFFRLGFLVAWLAHPVISGFTTAAAMIIFLSQAKYIVGFPIPKSQYVYKTVGHILTNIGETKALNCCLGLICLIFLLGCKTASKKWKKLWWLKSTSPLVVCALGILILSQTPSLKEDHYVKNVGHIPKGLPPSSMDWAFGATARVMPSCITIAVIGYMESIAISKSLAAIHSYHIDAGQELLAIGLTNFIGSAFSVYPCSGSFCRSSVNNGMGAKTGFSSYVNSTILLMTILFMAPVFYHLPKFVLGAVVMSAVTGLIETGIKDGIHLYKIRKHDFALWAATWLGTLFLGVIPGIASGVAVSLFFVIYETVHPKFTVLWRLPGTSIYRSVEEVKNGAFVPGVFIIRPGSSIYFANAAYVKDHIYDYVRSFSKVDPVRYVIIDMTSVTSVDSSAAHALEEMIKDFKSQGIRLSFANISPFILALLRRAHVDSKIGEEWMFSTVHVAVQGCLKDRRAKALPASKKAAPENDEEEGSTNSGSGTSPDTAVTVGEEVSVSNEMHDQYTVIYINAHQSNADTLIELTKILKVYDLNIIRAEVDKMQDGNATHMCFWVANQQGENKKVNGPTLETLTKDINSWLSNASHMQISFEKQISVDSCKSAVFV